MTRTDERRPAGEPGGVQTESIAAGVGMSTVPRTPREAAEEGPQRAADGADAWWWSGAEAAVYALARSGREFTADDLRNPPFAIPVPDSPNRVGALFMTLSRRGVIEAVAVSPARSRSRHGALVRVWRGVTS